MLVRKWHSIVDRLMGKLLAIDWETRGTIFKKSLEDKKI